CRIVSLFLRCNGELMMAVNQLDGIGSSLSVPTKDGRIKSLADGPPHAPRQYLPAKHKFRIPRPLPRHAHPPKLYPEPKPRAAPEGATVAVKPKEMFKLKCPSCDVGTLAFQEGCVKCHSCGYSQC